MTGQPQIVNEAKFAPNRCVYTGDNIGPFLWLGRPVPRVPHYEDHETYIQLRWIEPALREAGWMDPAHSEQLVADASEVNRLSAENEKLRAQLQAIKEAVYENTDLPVRTVEVVRVRHRAPTEDEVRRWIMHNPGTYEHLINDVPDIEIHRDLYKPPAEEQPEEQPRPLIEVLGTLVNMEDVLSKTIPEVVQFAERQEAGVIADLIAYESENKNRSTLINTLKGLVE